MRIFLTILVNIVFIGGLTLYMNSRTDALPAPRETVKTETARTNYSLEITTTFAVEPDPFAIRTDDSAAAPALLVRLGDREILRKTDRMEGGFPLAADLPPLNPGNHEIWFEASPPLEASGKSQAIRVRVLADGNPVTDKTFWSAPGGNVSDILRFAVEAPREKEVGHDH